MATIDDSRSLASLTIPGTHESASLYEPAAGIAKCQTLTLAEQLDAGVRYFDIRCGDVGDTFELYHGPLDEQQTFDQVIDTMLGFLDSHPTETVIMSVKEETAAANTTRSFEATFDAYVAKAPDRWYLGDAVPPLGNVRGKIVLLRRFTATALPTGIDASGWADDTTFTLTDINATLRIEDVYKVTADPAKWTAITALLTEAHAATGTTLYLTYTSGFQTKAGLPDIPSVASVINPMLDAYLADPANAHAHLGVLAMDLVEPPRVAAVAAFNAP